MERNSMVDYPPALAAMTALPRDSNGESSDQALLVRYRGGDEDAATALYLRYAKRLRSLAQKQTAGDLTGRMDPDDVVQTVFRTFFRRASEGHYQIPRGDELWKLFLVIALHKIRDLGDYHRAAKRNIRRTVELEKSARPVPVSGASDDESYRILRLTIEDLLQSLPPSQREIVMLRIRGHEINEIAAATRRAKRTVERMLQEFRTQLCDQLTQE
jgi:RNA polymerase sigma-70 factor (ECF subfamily)